MKYVILFIYIVSVFYVHRRGSVRYGFWRQLSDHSTFVAPLNCFMYLFSRIPTTPYLSTEQFPELKVLQENWQKIRDEGDALQKLQQIKTSDKYNDAGFNSFFKTGWKRFYLKWYDDAHPSAGELCPFTTQLLRTMPGVKAAMFAELPDGSRLPRHRDPYAGSLRYHLGLATPNDDRCFIDVDGVRYSWRDGEGVIFDETYIHYAENTSGENRLILFCDIERPMRYRWTQAVNHWCGRHLVGAAAAPNQEGDRTGGINRAFKYIYSIRKVGKRLKQWNKPIYYLIKWILFASIAILIWRLL
ncbi:aspartyl beta-hydroxylase [Erwinia sp. OLTSP20]|uniref:lipid A hydroxylase LpxO n=1 Tax=unclassified Erwinia TaxID=2622719 RepID=UPI000C18C383|nr:MULTISPECIES: lipid A hydroxylase LpxO [unclassified Erwinia]PIJ49978.1 aspartyl beta-hydroxylase [Erwinia sp. OAMSP11]PIJ71374.1 aspartyl beta-hydroxylase [Erwinia sp. OLSSP12]PIJ80609.1 aspartyl beta-hydroxylase [Erwinia sp. OLCASP19]PIJ82795.1 aspartyl beta-hydroxylase [Erwinia sp. OLMTSP26]PIJ85480.1 aspartyl beta-hydroxylase [Erwinia sp. OLMDSP33]